jgi:hypothetical protein
MRIALGEFLSRVLVKARKKYRFAGLMFGGYGFGIIWPSKKAPQPIPANQPDLPGINI